MTLGDDWIGLPVSEGSPQNAQVRSPCSEHICLSNYTASVRACASPSSTGSRMEDIWMVVVGQIDVDNVDMPRV